jgi:hypothetical protein
MRRGIWVGLLLIGLLGIAAWAQCDCKTENQPSCYESFWTTEVIGISLVVPGEFFWLYNTTTPPRILGWRVETWDGLVVRAEFFDDGPYPLWHELEWDLTDWEGCIVESGFYRIVVETTNAGDVSTPVQIVDRCGRCCDCYCWSCYPVKCSHPCMRPCGEPFLDLEVTETRTCSRLTFSFQLQFEIECCTGP